MAQQPALDARLKRSHDNLQAARETATQARGYASATTREALRKAFTDRFGSAPHEWQVDVTEALLLGLDSVVIAGTGAGKTMPFMMPLLHDKTKIVVIISPLNILEKDMAARFEKMGIAAVPVNKQTWNERLHQELKDLKWRAILLSPEMGLENPAIRELLGSKAYAERITAFIIDECHCISQWGGEFRPKYSLVEKFRAFVPTHIPFLATSATLPSAALTETCMKLNIDLPKSFFLNLGNDRPNLTPTVIRIKSTNDYTELKRLITTGVISPEDLEQTVVYIDSVASTQHLVREIRSWFPNDFHDAIDCLSSRRTEFAKEDVMERFSKGVVKILVATEAAGMGADIPNITRVIQFGLCKSLSIWTQRAGRAGRSPGVHASVYLLVEESMFHRRKRKKGEAGDDAMYIVNAEDEGAGTEDETVQSTNVDPSPNEIQGRQHPIEDDGKVWARKVEEPFRRWIQAPGCRRDVSDEYFDSPRPRKAPTGACCDRCMQTAEDVARQGLRASEQLDPGTSRDHEDESDDDYGDPTDDEDAESSSESDDGGSEGERGMRRSRAIGRHSKPSTMLNVNGKRPMGSQPKRPSNRRGDHLKDVRACLETWRYRKKRDMYSPSSFATSAILPDPTLTALATKTSLKTVDDLLALKTPWIFAKKHGEEVLEVIRRVDVARKAALEQAKAEKSAKKKQATADRKEKEREQRLAASARKRDERAAIRDAARAPASSTLVGSFTFNMGTSTPRAQQAQQDSNPANSYGTPPSPAYISQRAPPFHPYLPASLSESSSSSAPSPSGVAFASPISSNRHPFAAQYPMPYLPMPLPFFSGAPHAATSPTTPGALVYNSQPYPYPYGHPSPPVSRLSYALNAFPGDYSISPAQHPSPHSPSTNSSASESTSNNPGITLAFGMPGALDNYTDTNTYGHGRTSK